MHQSASYLLSLVGADRVGCSRRISLVRRKISFVAICLNTAQSLFFTSSSLASQESDLRQLTRIAFVSRSNRAHVIALLG
jgi:hypothetical protein